MNPSEVTKTVIEKTWDVLKFAQANATVLMDPRVDKVVKKIEVLVQDLVELARDDRRRQARVK